jgi:hypothetical protein
MDSGPKAQASKGRDPLQEAAAVHRVAEVQADYPGAFESEDVVGC